MDNSEKLFELADRLKALRDEKKDVELILSYNEEGSKATLRWRNS